MQIGTKSLIFGAHQFLWHPIAVFLAWCKLYGLPNWKELVCIVIHDWGYWGCSDIDGENGNHHPYLAARIAGKYLDDNNYWHGEYGKLCLCHSRYCAKENFMEPSELCWADKLSVKYDPWWLYLPRVIISGEIKEFRQRADDFGECRKNKSNREWYLWVQERMIRKAYNRDVRVAYHRGD
jgi:hypothetical protein